VLDGMNTCYDDAKQVLMCPLDEKQISYVFLMVCILMSFGSNLRCRMVW